MSRKDYILIAEVFRIEYQNTGLFANKRAQSAIASLASELCDALHADNPRFNREHFLAVVRGERALTSRPARNGGAA